MIKDLIIDYKEGMEIKPPCIIRNMPSEVYHSIEGLSNSGLKMLLDCPARYYFKYLSGEYEAKEKPSFKIGKACHTYILEGQEAFENTYWHNPYSDYTKKEIVRILQEKFGYDCTIEKYLLADLMEMLLVSEGIEVKEIHLTKNELNQVIGTARAIKSNKHALAAFSQKGESELSIFWKDKDTGVLLKCRPDYLPYDCKLVPDYKTASSVNPNTFYGDFIKFGYHVQTAMYKEGIKAVTGIDVESFFFVAQEKEPPYITQVYLPDEAIITYGYKAVRKAIETYLECTEKGFWDTYTSHIIQMSLEPRPEDLPTNFDKEIGVCYAPYYIDSILAQY